MPMQYVRVGKPAVDGLGSNRSKLRKHRRQAWALMNLRLDEFNKAKAKLEELMAEHELLTKQFSLLANQLKAKGLDFDQIRVITGAPKSVVEANMKKQVKLIA